MSININTSSTYLRTQSYIINGEPNPNKLSNASRKKYFSNFIKDYINSNQKVSKNNINKKHYYITEIKKKKKKKISSLDKFNKNNIKKEKVNKDINKEKIYSNKSLNHSIKIGENEYHIKSKMKKENNNEIMNKKHKILFDNKSTFKEINMPIYGMNTFINKNINEKQFSITSENEKNNIKDKCFNITHNNKQFSNITKFKNKGIYYNLMNIEKLKKNKNIKISF